MKLFITALLSLCLILPAFAADKKVFTNEDLEKYKSKRDKQMSEEDRIKESERNLRNKERQVDMEEKMWRSINTKDRKAVTIEKE
jgi:hypothetical protein